MDNKLNLKNSSYFMSDNGIIYFYRGDIAGGATLEYQVNIDLIKEIRTYQSTKDPKVFIYLKDGKSRQIDLAPLDNIIIVKAWLEDIIFPDPENNRFAKAQKRYNRFVFVFVFLVLLVIVVIVALPSKHHSPSDSAEYKEPKKIVFNSGWDYSVRQVEKYLKSTLNDPNSYESIKWFQVVDAGENSNTFYRYYVKHHYRAKNAFGGYIIKRQIFYLDDQGNVLTSKDE